MFEEHGDDTPKHLEIVEAPWVGAGIVGHEQPEKDENKILQTEGQPVDVTP